MTTSLTPTPRLASMSINASVLNKWCPGIPTFESAGGHHSPDKRAHGVFAKDGPHVGDLPNLHVPEDGQRSADLFIGDLTLGAGSGTLLDGNGSALVIHAGEDDYRTEPAGGSGNRIACGVILR
jgi:Cu-Zn family superoxide dismutase